MAPKPAPKKTPPPKPAAASAAAPTAPKPAPAAKKTTPPAKPKVAELPPVSAAKAKSPPVGKKVAPVDEKTPVSAAKSEAGGSSVKSPPPAKAKLPEVVSKTEEKKPVSAVKSPVPKVAVVKVKSPSVSKEKVKVDGAKAANDENKTVSVVKSPESGKASTAPQKVEEVKAADPLPKVEENCKEEPKVETESDAKEVVTAEEEPMEEEGMEQEPVEVPMEDDTEKGVVEEPGDDTVGEEVGEEVEAEEGEGEEEDDGEDGDEEEEEVDEEVEEEEPEAEVERLVAEVEEQAQISDMVKARKMKKQHEIFVGGLDRDAVEDDLRKVFEKVGEVVEIRLHKEFSTEKNKGFAFVKFANKEQVEKAFAELKNPLIRGKRCGIVPSEDNDTLFLGNICNSWTKEAIKTKLKDYGIHNIENITLVADTKNEGLSRGFAFLEFACHADAMLAYKRLQKPDAKFGHPLRTAKVAFAEPIQEPDPEVMAQVKQVFVDGLPPYWDEDRVKEQFKGYGEIESITLARNMSSARRKDFGFVNFTTHEAAVACSEGANGTVLGDGKLKMKVKARLSNPQPKAQAVKGGMAGGYRIGHNGIGVYSKFARGYSRGKSFPGRTAVQRGRSLNIRGRGRGGRFAHDSTGSSHSEFRGRRPFGIRGGRVAESTRGGASRGRGRPFPPRRQPYAPEEDYDTPYNARFVGDDPYLYVDGGRGVKRPFPMMERDPDYLEYGSRVRPRYEHPDSVAGRYRGSSGLYSRDYYESDYGDRTYSSRYGGGQTGRGYYY